MRRSTCNRLPAMRRPALPYASVAKLIDTSLVRARCTLSGKAALEQMASDMREAAYREGGLTRDGMELLGWTGAQIDSLARDARALANTQAVMS